MASSQRTHTHFFAGAHTPYTVGVTGRQDPASAFAGDSLSLTSESPTRVGALFDLRTFHVRLVMAKNVHARSSGTDRNGSIIPAPTTKATRAPHTPTMS